MMTASSTSTTSRVRSKSSSSPVLLLLILCAGGVLTWNARSLQLLVQEASQFNNILMQQQAVAPANSLSIDTRTTTIMESPPAAAVDAAAAMQKKEALLLEQTKEQTRTKTSHRVAGLHCDAYGGPSEEDAAEMVYWRDIPKDAEYKSPFATSSSSTTTTPSPKKKYYLTFEPDEGGWNNIRMSMETAVALALITGRILVLPPEQKMYLLDKDDAHKNNRFTFRDFFHFDSIQDEHIAVQVISMEEYMETEALKGHLQNIETGEVSFPPNNASTWDGHHRKGKAFWTWLRSVTQAPLWNFDQCVAAFPAQPGVEAAEELRTLRKDFVRTIKTGTHHSFLDKPVPVDASVKERVTEILGDRRRLCVYGTTLQESHTIHFMGDNASGARLLTHFYSFLFLQNWKHDLWIKRFVRDHLRYVDDIQCHAAQIVAAMRQHARENGEPNGHFDTFHIRRGDFQYKETRIEAHEIYETIKDVMTPNSTIFIATDETKLEFFDYFKEQHHHVYFLRDFAHLTKGMNKNFYGMVDQRIASRGRVFVGAYFSTFTGYINRMRGYHSQKEKLPGYELGITNSYYYSPRKNKDAARHYISIKAPFWAREFPVGWRDIDHDV